MSLWQGDWKEIEIDGTKKWLVAFMDDSSRLITCYAIFDSPTTENTITVLTRGFREYGIPREILTDHGSQFVSVKNREHVHHIFGEFLTPTTSNTSWLELNTLKPMGKLNGSSGRLNAGYGNLDLLIKSFTGTTSSSLT